MAVVNKVHERVWRDSITAPYIVTHNYPYIHVSSSKPEIHCVYCSYLQPVLHKYMYT